MKSNQPLVIPSSLDVLVMFCRSANILPLEMTLEEVRQDIRRDYIDFARLHPELVNTDKAMISVISSYATNRMSEPSRKKLLLKQIVAEARIARFSRAIH